MKRLVLAAVVTLALGGTSRAEEPPKPPAPGEPVVSAPGPGGESEPTKDLIDVLRDLRHKPAPPPPASQPVKGTAR